MSAGDDPTALTPGGVHQQATAIDGSHITMVGRDHNVYYSDGKHGRRRTVSGPVVAECPYPGLAAFEPEQARWFFGRDALVADLLSRLDRRLTTGGLQVVVAPSGAGKSSLLRAGLLSRLHRGALPGSEGWPTLVFTPTAAPMAALEAHLSSVPHEQDRLVVVVDQFEELFTLCDDDGERARFIDALADLADDDALVVLGLRADFYAACVDHSRLAIALQDAPLVVGPMTDAQLREAILHPALDVGLEVEPGLVELLLHHLGATGEGYEAGRLPLLAHALRVCWQERHGATLTVQGYRDTGGIRHAITVTAEQVYTRLGDEGRREAQSLFLRLVRIGDGPEDTRRFLDRAELVDVADTATAVAVVDAFTQARLITQQDDSVGITHEALLRSWPRLRDWIAADRDWLRTRQRLVDDTLAWEEADRDPSMLYRGNRLAAVSGRDTAELPSTAAAFLAAGHRADRARQRRRRAVQAGLGLLTTAALIAVFIAVRNADNATTQRTIALSRQLAAQSLVVDQTDPRLARQLAAAAWHVSPTDRAGAAMGTLLERQEHNGILIGLGDDVTGVAFNPAGTALAATDGLEVRLWNAADGRPAGTLARPDFVDLMQAVAYAPDGTKLATSGTSGSVQVFDAGTRREIARARPHEEDPVADDGEAALAFSPDGTLLATTDVAEVRLWNPADLRETGPPLRVTDPGRKVTAVAFHPSGTTLATAADDGTVRLWDPVTHAGIGDAITATTDESFGVVALAFSPTGTALATGDGDGMVRLWNPSTGQPVGAPLAVHPSGKVDALAFSPDGATLVTQSSGVVRFWETATGRETTGSIPIDDGAVAGGLAFRPDGTVLAIASGDGTVRLHNPANGRPIGEPVDAAAFGYQASQAAFNRSGTLLATADTQGTVRLWDPVTQRRHGRLLATTTGYGLNDLAFNPDGTVLATAGQDGTVRLWDPATQEETGPSITMPQTYGPDGFYGAVDVAFDQGGTVLATASGDGTVRLWDPATGHQIGEHIVANPFSPDTPRYSAVRAMAFHPSGTILATVGGDGVVRLWDKATQRQVGADIKHPGPHSEVDDLAFHPDGTMLATAGTYNSEVRLWSPTTQQEIGSPLVVDEDSPFRRGVDHLAFSPSGTVLAAATGDRAVRLWHPGTGRQLGVPIFPAEVGQVWDLVFSPTSDALVTVVNAGTAATWHTDRWADPYRTLCEEAGAITRKDWEEFAPGEPAPTSCT
ncbi:WD40 repeat protein [Saccharothrix tamanrassetensis]|uniref:WD40 repeat protein n=1 Tax=Saccharothrix tamanrassetensis TaxID=1051531 RepID=A0A841CF97_9PSEU|nr:hypothetical protein [Saccharothrix tamanrassetensis]MBB5956009.1 WD40 repeat protein [Saccharothrix tamanrassetensis]